MVAQKASSKAGRTPMETRRSKSKALKEEGTPTPSTRSTGKKRGSNRSNQSFTHHLPTDEQKKCNGRVQGRSLIVWGRPRMAEKLLLHIQYECQRARIDLPWNSIAHRLHPGSSGAAIGQHLNRLRRELIAEGHMVPPLPQSRGGGTVDSSIRGYVRLDMEGTDKETTRPVSFSEKLEDRRYNLVDAFDLDMSDTPAMVTEAREEDPFVDSPAFKRSSHTFGSTRQTPMGAYSSFCSTDNAEPIDQFLHGPVLGSATIDGFPGPRVFVGTPSFNHAASASVAYNVNPSTPSVLQTPVTPVRSKSTPNMPYGYSFSYHLPYPLVSPSPGQALGESPAQAYAHGSFPYPSWETHPHLAGGAPMDPSLRLGQAVTPTSSPAQPLEEDQQEEIPSVEDSFDDIIAVDDENEEIFKTV